MQDVIQIESARAGDIPALTAIYNHVIETTTAVYSEQPVTTADREAWWNERLSKGYPVLVARMNGDCLGYSTFGDFRAWPCYLHSVEHSVHVRSDARGRGVGRLLVQDLFSRAEALGKHVMIAGVDAENEASLRLHHGLGFHDVGTFREVGRKFGRWLDLTFLQKRLST